MHFSLQYTLYMPNKYLLSISGVLNSFLSSGDSAVSKDSEIPALTELIFYYVYMNEETKIKQIRNCYTVA